MIFNCDFWLKILKIVEQFNQVCINTHFNITFVWIQYQILIEEYYYIWNNITKYNNAYLRSCSMCLTHIYTMLESSSSESLLVLTRATQHIAKNYMHKSSVIYYMTESSQMQIFYSFYFQVLSASHPYYLVSAHIYIYPSICIYLHFLISSYCSSFLISLIMFYIYYIWF